MGTQGQGSGPARVFLHVGSPKTGTTFLQNVLWSQHDTAREQGLLLPGSSTADHYLANLDLRGLSAQEHHPDRAVGMWRRLVDEALAWDGDVLITHELFAGATADHAAAAVAAFGPETEVHLVVTARDLVRQVPAEWQERIKHRRTATFPEFVDDLVARTGEATWFWEVHDYAALVRRWGSTLPPERVHVVTVPGSGAGSSLLWERFAGLLGLDPASFDLTRSRANRSLGAEQVELLRRVNAALGDALPHPGPYSVDVKTMLAQRVLVEHPGTRLRLSPEDRALAVQWSRDVARELERLGVDVVGDLAELVPPEGDPEADPTAPTLRDEVSDERLLAESVAALVGVLDEHRERRAERDNARRQLQKVRAELAQARRALAEAQAQQPESEAAPPARGLAGRLRRTRE
ncbi:hypothetical protein K1X13_11405 [Nocardioides sp. WL0053]|uniref:Sulfotransferase family protein n=1 Tax=Nocardioides jiangsuensis TaxID=2866161 RepID=A0ABS7RPF5_9ACTN|nr:hypothetical protein [Nocardioides jiangsuensis]MBY9075427.1 hypothetical protein [Nocardioides jiangsuensis]